MEYNEFVKIVEDELLAIKSDSENVVIRRVMRSNGVESDSLAIRCEDRNIVPVIYIEDYYDNEVEELGTREIAKKMYKHIQENMNTGLVDSSWLLEYKKVKTKLFLRLMNYEKNNILLKNVPHYIFLDLAVCPYLVVDNFTDEPGTMLVTNDLMKVWGVDSETVLKDADYNTTKEGVKIISFSKMILGIDLKIGADIPTDKIMNENPIVGAEVWTNERTLYGAIGMIYENELRKFCERYNSNAIIIPSSVHEIIVIPTKDLSSINIISEMISEVNRNELPELLFLSDTAYYYEKQTGNIQMYVDYHC